ncbi:unnamed protein product [Owenia fusiformis]|uniref:Uncharacterized protein n=1 Tax=Owenia fusiformis TaxID=6347 RepID=A0A8J1U6V9_OWEFU|nr:unnamed protein product [Owenia fusiformis]
MQNHIPFESASEIEEYENIRRDCLRRRILFEDAKFPANDQSLYYSRQPKYRIEWMRPMEISARYNSRPQLFVDGAGRFDLRQGTLGDCWVVASTACMSENMELLYRVIPRGQGFHDGHYAGIFVFLFYRFGQWKEVVIDDRLPTVNGQLFFVHSRAPNEFWGALLEKAYAKLNGSYEALKSGLVADCLTDLTGGIVEGYVLRGEHARYPKNIINVMFKALERQSLIGCGINAVDGVEGESKLPNGLVGGHAYSITDLREIRLISDQGEIPITLVRVRNPWGTRIEWNGPWSDRSPEWNSIPPQDRQAMGLVFRDDGEFWMDFRDFQANMDTLDICNLTPDSPLETPRKWVINQHYDQWKKRLTAGGRPSQIETHWMNPQFKMSLRDADDDDDDICTLVIELSQKDKRRLKHKGSKNHFIGFVIYKCVREFPNVPMPKKYFQYHTYIDKVDYYSDKRQLSKRFSLPPGEYVVVPSTYHPDEESEFMLRICFEKDNHSELPAETAEVPTTNPIPNRDPAIHTMENSFKQFFYDISGEDMECDVYEFRKVLNNGLRNDENHKDIGLDACKSMVSLVDVDHSGKLGYNEFVFLWDSLKMWKKTFYSYDADGTGSINSFELRNALAAHGYKLTTHLLHALMVRFEDESHQISLDNFLICMARLILLSNSFKKYENNTGNAVFTLQEYFQEAVVL